MAPTPNAEVESSINPYKWDDAATAADRPTGTDGGFPGTELTPTDGKSLSHRYCRSSR
jgi:hypothetical protein